MVTVQSALVLSHGNASIISNFLTFNSIPCCQQVLNVPYKPSISMHQAHWLKYLCTVSLVFLFVRSPYLPLGYFIGLHISSKYLSMRIPIGIWPSMGVTQNTLSVSTSTVSSLCRKVSKAILLGQLDVVMPFDLQWTPCHFLLVECPGGHFHSPMTGCYHDDVNPFSQEPDNESGQLSQYGQFQQECHTMSWLASCQDWWYGWCECQYGTC